MEKLKKSAAHILGKIVCYLEKPDYPYFDHEGEDDYLQVRVPVSILVAAPGSTFEATLLVHPENLSDYLNSDKPIVLEVI